MSGSEQGTGQLRDRDHSLAGIRVLDFSRILAGPFSTMLLGDLGADVIKIESPQGDDTRHWGPPWQMNDGEKQSAYFLSVNRNKRSCVLDLKKERDQLIARDLASRSQVVVENFKPGEMRRFGLDYDQLREANEGLVYCSISGFGQTGPDRDRLGYDFIIQAVSGLMSITGPVDGPPCKVGVAISDVFAGLFATVSILAALRHSEMTGEGEKIDISLLECQIAALVNVASNFLVSGQPGARYGNEHPNIVPYQSLETSDREIALAVGNDRQFQRLCDVIEHPQLAADPRFATNPSRVENRSQLLPILQAIFHQKGSAEWISLLRRKGIPCGVINDVPTALNHPQIRSRGLIQEFQSASGDWLRLVGSPLRMTSTPPGPVRLPPRLGQHTEEILQELSR